MPGTGNGGNGDLPISGHKLWLYNMNNSKDLLYITVPIISNTVLYAQSDFFEKVDLMFSVLTIIKQNKIKTTVPSQINMRSV